MSLALESRPSPEPVTSRPPSSRSLGHVVSTVLPLVCLVLAMARLTMTAASPLSNADTWFHLSIGHRLWDGWSLGAPGRLSSFATTPWVPTQWSTEMVAARAESWFGLPGVAWLFGALFLCFLVAVYVVTRREGGPLPATLATILTMLASSAALSARPQVVSLILLTVALGAWLRTSRTLRAPWLLVPLTWVWATAHGLWSAGVVLGVVCVVGIVLDRRPDRRTTLRLAAVPVLSVVAAALTPVGPRLLTSQSAVAARAPMIGEWMATSFRTAPAFLAAVMIGVVVLRWARSREVDWLPVLLLCLAAGWTALVTRTVSSGAIVAAPLLARALQEMLGDRFPWRPAARAERGVLAGALVACLAGLAMAVPHTAVRAADVPSGLDGRLAALPDGSPVAVEDLAGDWIEWQHPRLDPMIDGMLDAYPVDYIKAFTSYKKLEPGWTGFLARSRARVAVTLKGSPLSTAMQDQLHWRVADTDGDYVYLVAPRR